MHGLARGGDAVGLFMRPLLLLGPGGQIVAKRDHIGEPRRQLPIGIAKEGLQHGNAVEAEQPFIGIVQKLAQIGPRILRLRKPKPSELQDEQRMLGDRQGQRPGGMATPAIGAGKPEREIVVVPIERGRIEKIEPFARQRLTQARCSRMMSFPPRPRASKDAVDSRCRKKEQKARLCLAFVRCHEPIISRAAAALLGFGHRGRPSRQAHP